MFTKIIIFVILFFPLVHNSRAQSGEGLISRLKSQPVTLFDLGLIKLEEHARDIPINLIWNVRDSASSIVYEMSDPAVYLEYSDLTGRLTLNYSLYVSWSERENVDAQHVLLLLRTYFDAFIIGKFFSKPFRTDAVEPITASNLEIDEALKRRLWFNISLWSSANDKPVFDKIQEIQGSMKVH